MLRNPSSRRRAVGATTLLAGLVAAGAVAVASDGPNLSTLPGGYSEPRGVAFAPDGAFLVADTKHHRVQRVANGLVTTVAGTGAGDYTGDGGAATAAELKEPAAVAPIPGGGYLIADTRNHRIRKVDAFGTITTVAGTGDGGFSGDGGAATAARVKEPQGIVALDATDFVFADTGNDAVRRVAGGVIGTIPTSVSKPSAVAVRPDGAILVADTDGDRIVSVSPQAVQTTISAGSGIEEPEGVAARANGHVLVSDTKHHRVVEIDPAGRTTVVAGTGRSGAGPDGPASAAKLDEPAGIAVDSAGRVLVANRHADAVHLLVDPNPAASTPVPASVAPARPATGPDKSGGKDDGSEAKKPADSDGAGADGVATVLSPSAPPELGKSVTTQVARGRVRVRPPGADDYASLEAGASVPLGSVIDTTKGAVELTSARDASGRTQTATFSHGAFEVGQSGGKRPVTELALTGALARCPSSARKTLARSSARSSSRRRLWGDGKGRFRTKGKHSSATVRGTRWLTEDRCDSTLVEVVHGVVGVRDYAKRRTVTVKGGERYVAKAPQARRRASR